MSNAQIITARDIVSITSDEVRLVDAITVCDLGSLDIRGPSTVITPLDYGGIWNRTLGLPSQDVSPLAYFLCIDTQLVRVVAACLGWEEAELRGKGGLPINLPFDWRAMVGGEERVQGPLQTTVVVSRDQELRVCKA